ncbi:hypothetical protein KC678_01265 [Candidatus Dojkabacteria bacterium]|uniref:Uncharacterized protein n=1 Tax=Candidatus Dojkabacteria bacterium TaxID=2099670 RepID=A0A955I921_9BACT|nr:hypothetical protein [Candidatus Dojkabacteria bacterium]
MNKIMKYKQSFYIIFTVFILVLAAPVLLINTLFNYSDYNSSLIVSLSATTEENSVPDSLINEFTSESNVTRVDFENKTVTFQNTSYEDVRDFTESKIEDPEAISYTLSWVNPSRSEAEVVNTIFSSIVIFSVVGLLASIYFVYQKSSAQNGLLTILKISGVILLGVLIATILQLVYVSIISRVYQVTELDVLTILISGIWTSIIASLSFLQLRFTAQNNFKIFMETLKVKILMLRKFKYGAVVFLIIPLFFGLGSQFVIPGILLVGAMLSPLAAFLTLLRVYDRYNKRDKKGSRTVKVEFSNPKSSSKKAAKGNQPWKKRFKKKHK